MSVFSRKKGEKPAAGTGPGSGSQTDAGAEGGAGTGSADGLPAALDRDLAASPEHIAILNRVLTATRGPYEVQELLELLVKEIVDAVGARWGTIKLKAEEGDVVHTMIRRPGIRAGTVPRTIENTAFFLVMGSGEPLMVENLTSDSRFPPDISEEHALGNLLAVPIQRRGDKIGVLILVGPAERSFSSGDISLAGLLAGEAGSLIENARLLEEAMERRAMEKERQLAEDVWRKFLPDEIPSVEGFEIAASCMPASRIGGDYYDVIRMHDGRTLVALGDVSGSGMPAALLMSNLQAALRMSVASDGDPAQIVAQINKHICSTTDTSHFATLFLGIMDAGARTLAWVNAGHNPPFLFQAGGACEELEATGIPVGFVADSTYESRSTQLSPGDRLMVLSDGITEAFNASEEMFGDDRVKNLVSDQGQINSADLVTHILGAVDEWCAGSTAYTDDRTIVIVSCCCEE